MKDLISKVVDKDAAGFINGLKEKVAERVEKAKTELKDKTIKSLQEAKKEMFKCIKPFTHETHVIKNGDTYEGSSSLNMIYVPDDKVTTGSNVIEYGSSSEMAKFWKKVK